jgi:LmbE family N-acetylglucosaminyl deacetylase
MTKRIAGVLILLFFISFKSFAQSNIPSAEIYLKLKKLNVLGSVLYIAAHPDDENTRLLAYFSKDRLYRTGYLSLTRGDGGQNLIGDEQGVELGLIRTQELLSARRIDGGEQFFSRAFDFGFSKNPAETFTKWDKEKILSDVVWVIRKFQPDVIITRFPTTGEGGHGHHTASAILANEAFTAAADPKRFPEQLKYVQPWQATRILWNTFNFGGNNTTRDDQFHFDVGGYNPVLGKSYGEIAAESRSQHKSQGFGVPRSRGEAIEYFSTTGGSTPQADLFDNIETTWSRVKGSEAISSLVNAAIAGFDFLHPEKSVPSFVQLYKAVKQLPSSAWRDKKLQETQELIEDASGLWIEAFTNQQYSTQGDSLLISTVVNNRLGVNAAIDSVYLNNGNFSSGVHTILSKNKNFPAPAAIRVADNMPVTQPYWLKEEMESGMFTVNNQQEIGLPDVQPSFTMNFVIAIEGELFTFSKAVKYKFTDPVKGELYEPLVVLPKAEVSFVKENYLSLNGKPAGVQVKLFSNTKEQHDYSVRLNTSANWINNSPVFTVKSPDGNPVYQTIDLVPAGKALNSKEAGELSATSGNMMYDRWRRSIHYDHIPYITWFPKATTNLVQVQVNTRGKRIGYIVGAGDKVPEGLEAMGYEVTLVAEKELARTELKNFDAIITGVRAYNTDEWLNNYYSKLMKYVEEGGNLIVQYNTSNNIGPVRAKIGPYPFNISRNRITDENAAVTFLKPDHVILNYPNKITEDDFKGWIQERSIYHATDFEKNFETVLRMNDPGEAADDGSLITARYGKGFFTYTGIVFFRELPAGVPGAYRLLANLIALNQKKEL